MCQPTPQELKTWLEWAGQRLLALPVGRIYPSEHKVAWPDYSQDKWEILDFRQRVPLTAGAPSSDEIPVMEAILLLPNICDYDKIRRVLHARALVYPVSNKYKFSWERVAKLLGTSQKLAKSLHKRGLAEVLAKTPASSFCALGTFMEVRVC